MTKKEYEENAKYLVHSCMEALSLVFTNNMVLDMPNLKQWFGTNIKENRIGGYRNLTLENSKAVFDIIANGETYHMGIDFAKQVIHVTITPGNVYSLYFRESSAW